MQTVVHQKPSYRYLSTPILIVDESAMARTQQQRHFGARYVGVDLVNPRFDRLAEVYGARGYYVTRLQDIAETVAAALKLDVASVTEIPVAEYFPLAAKLPGAAGGH